MPRALIVRDSRPACHTEPIQPISMSTRLGIRWTIGNVSQEGFEALHLSVWGLWRVFKSEADYLVCTNGISPETILECTGPMPPGIHFQDTSNSLPDCLHDFLDAGMAEGTAWKFAPLRAFPHQFELCLDNDCILWRLPMVIEQWLSSPASEQQCLIAEDVVRAFGQFSYLCGAAPRNSGIRGFPPKWNFEAALSQVLQLNPVVLQSELDEQGLYTAAVSLHQPPKVVGLRDVSICSPFPPHLQQLGHCGAHFCGINAKTIPWTYEGRPAVEWTRQNWEMFRPDLYRRIQAPRAREPFLWRETKVWP